MSEPTPGQGVQPADETTPIYEQTEQDQAQQRAADTSVASGPEQGEQQPDPQPVPAGEPVTIQPASTTGPGEPADEPQPGVVPDTVYPAAAGQPPGALVADPPPAAGPGEQSLAEQQAGGQQVVGGVPQPTAGPGASDSAVPPAAVTPPDQAAADQGLDENEAATMPVSPATSNESPQLPPNLTSSAARAHAMLEHAQNAGGDGEQAPEDRLGRVLSIVELALSELAKFLPDHVRAPARVEATQAVDRL